MGYKALYRKWRPTVFDDVVGQAHITNTLKNEIKEEKIAHAYLFTGTRGTGKTSTAKIFSRAVNCENSHGGNPCNECATCKSIINDTVLDIVEIDAASNTGVDNIRSVIEQVQYAPTVGKYKVYIIDEVHMLSGGAFNALLKTLEEPPSHVIFILATTETHKVPATILSRCQRFDFKTITVEDISSRISYILGKEKIDVEKDAINYISYLGQGSMRDSLSILEQCLSFSNGKLTYNDAIDILGSIDDKIYYDLAALIAEGKSDEVVVAFEKLISEGKNLDNFTPGFLEIFRKIAVSKISNGAVSTSYSDEKNNLIKEIADKFEKEKLFGCIDLLSELITNLKLNSMQQTLIEISLIRMANLRFSNDFSSLISRIEFLEDKLNGVEKIPNSPKKEITAESKKEAVKPQINAKVNEVIQEKKSIPAESTKTIEKAVNNWKDVVEKVFNGGGLQLYSAVYSSKAVKKGDTLIVMCDDYNKKQILINSKSELLKIVKDVFGENIKLAFDELDTIEETNDNNLFSNLNNLSNKFPNNVELK